MNTINIENDDLLEFEITYRGEKTGDKLVFDTQEVDLLLRYQQMEEEDLKNREWLRNQLIIIEKREDVKGKGNISKNTEDTIKVTKQFFEKEEKTYNMFLGENGVKKLLCGRQFGWLTLDYIDEIIEKYILPKLDLSFDNLKNKIIKKYDNQKDENVI